MSRDIYEITLLKRGSILLKETKMSQVFFAPLKDNVSINEQVKAVVELLTKIKLGELIAPNDFVAVKLHVGEENNTTHVRPELIKAIVDEAHRESANVFLTETSTLYKGERENAVKHLMHAYKHGFGIERVGAPFIMADGLTGGSEIEVTIDGIHEKKVKIAREIAIADVLIVVSHPTGHVQTGLGACLKNLGMGLASRAGKLRQHSAVKPEVSPQCRFCKKCIKWCPEAAIVEHGQQALVLTEKCIGCGECLTICRYDAIKYDWGTESGLLQQRMVEHAYGVIKGKEDKCVYINVLVNMTSDCDCYNTKQSKLIPDLGILISKDPVAIDKATLDLTMEANRKSLAEMSYPELDPMNQLEHGVRLGMGSLEYELVRVNI